MRKLLALFVILIFTSLACNYLTPQSTAPTTIPVADVLLKTDPNRPATPTPFQPLPPTASPTATATPVNTPTRTPVPLNIPSGNQNTGSSSNRTNIVVFGSDFRPGGGYRTDVILLVSVDQQNHTVSLLSFPRDLWIFIPGVGMQRINVAQAYGGFGLTSATFDYNFGIHLDHYILTNFDGFRQIINQLNGVDVEIEKSLTDKCDLPQQVNKYCTVNPGTTHMDGATALWYVRSRYSTSDFDRTRRTQEVLLAIFNKLMSLDAVNKAPDLVRTIYQNVETDMSLDQILSVAAIAPELSSDPSRIHRYAIGPQQAYDYIVPGSGAWVEVPVQGAMMEVINQALSN
jgi:polyisoprenyl-teichoic acid--peptidoglycan teichoic acid transferase